MLDYAIYKWKYSKPIPKFIKTRDDFKFIGWWKNWDLNQPIADDNDITRPVALIKKV